MSLTPLLAAAAALTPFFPKIAQWIGGEGREGAATEIVQVAQKITGLSQTADMQQYFTSNPEAVLMFQKMLTDWERASEKTRAEDRQDARKRDMALVQVGRQNFRADFMVLAAALGLAFCLGALALYRETLPGEAVGIISTIAGIFGSCLKDAYTFEFGSSRGSKDKEAALLKKIP